MAAAMRRFRYHPHGGSRWLLGFTASSSARVITYGIMDIHMIEIAVVFVTMAFAAAFHT